MRMLAGFVILLGVAAFAYHLNAVGGVDCAVGTLGVISIPS